MISCLRQAAGCGRGSFADASEDLAVYSRLEVTAKQVQCVTEEVGRSAEDWNAPQSTAENPAEVV